MPGNRHLFLDLDGVLADFDRHAQDVLGIRAHRSMPDPAGLWRAINRHGSFFSTIPMMPDAWTLWNGALAFTRNPIILTGTPLVKNAEAQKKEWVRKYFGPSVRTICCLSRDKYKHAREGDVLIDDWDKYRSRWEEAGGIFILHSDAQSSLSQLEEVWK